MTQTKKLFLVALLVVGFSGPIENVHDAILVILRWALAVAFMAMPLGTGSKGT